MPRVPGVLLLLVLAAVSWAGVGKHPAYLKVKHFRPRHTSVRVPIGVTVTVKFSRPLESSTVNAANVELVVLSTGAGVPVDYTLDARGKTLALAPLSLLSPGTDYSVIVRPGLMSTDGRTLRSERHANFYTDPRSDVPQLIRPDQFEELESRMVEGRAAHSETLLTDGTVLLAGGLFDYTQYTVSGDRFDPGEKKFRPAGGQLSEGRSYHPAVRLGTDAILIGGSGVRGALSSTEIYRSALFEFQRGPELHEQRDFVAAVALKDGRILVTGGLSYTSTGGALYSETAEIYDPLSGGFRFTLGNPIARRAGHTLTLLPDGRVLVVGGQSGGASTPVTAELFDPVDETFTKTASGPEYHRQLHTATVIDSAGTVLLADGGSPLLELYDPVTNSFRAAGGASTVRRIGSTASLLPDGNVLLAGGLEDRGTSSLLLATFDLYVRPNGDYGSVRRPSVIFLEPRYGHTATTLGDGRVLYAGGFGSASNDSLASAVLFTPDPAPVETK